MRLSWLNNELRLSWLIRLRLSWLIRLRLSWLYNELRLSWLNESLISLATLIWRSLHLFHSFETLVNHLFWLHLGLLDLRGSFIQLRGFNFLVDHGHLVLDLTLWLWQVIISTVNTLMLWLWLRLVAIAVVKII
jgi:hypothetical protein